MSGTSTFGMVTCISEVFVVIELTMGLSTRTFEPDGAARSPEVNGATVTPELGSAIRTLEPAVLVFITF